MTGAIFLIKMNDAAGVIAMWTAACFYYGGERRCQVREWLLYLMKFAALYLAGMLLSFLPVCLYYLKYHIWGDMIDGYLLLNLSMVPENGAKASLVKRLSMMLQPYGLFSILPVFLMGISCLINWKKKEERVKRVAMLFTGGCIALATYTHVTGFPQHLIPAVMIWLLAAWSLFSDPVSFFQYKKIRIAGLLICLVCIFLCFARSVENSILYGAYHDWVWEDARQEDKLVDAIPKEERSSVFGVGKFSSWYFANDIYPAYKWLNLESFINHMGPEIAEEFESTLKENPVKYLIIPNDLEAHLGCLTEDTLIYIEEHYVLKERVGENWVYGFEEDTVIR